MRLFKTTLAAVSAVALLLGTMTFSPATLADGHGAKSMVEKGKAVAYNRKKGNCLGCHVMGEGALPGNIGPPLVAMKARFPDKAKLRAQIWDATVANPHSMMPPFGRHKALTEEEIDAIVEYAYTL